MTTTLFVQKIADKIADLKLTMPAILLLETHKPLAFLGSQLLLIAQPTLNLLLPQHFSGDLIELLAEPEQLEQLIVKLERKSYAAEVCEPPGVMSHD